MGNYTKGQTGTYTVTAELANRVPGVAEGEELVFLPLNVDDDDTASGVAFTSDGRTVPVIIPVDKPVEFPTEAPAGVNSDQWQAFQDFRAYEDAHKPGPDTPAARPADPAPATQPAQPTFSTGGTTPSEGSPSEAAKNSGE